MRKIKRDPLSSGERKKEKVSKLPFPKFKGKKFLVRFFTEGERPVFPYFSERLFI